MARTRSHPNVVVRMASPHCSKRLAGRPTMVVLHSTESQNRPGHGDLQAIGAWFQNPKSEVSAHVCTDADGNSAVYVPSRLKAWACGVFNSQSVNIEQVGQAAQKGWPTAQGKETARWIALYSIKYRIPIRKGIPGVVTHSMLGATGGGHHDPGPGYPLRRVLVWAAVYRARLLLERKRKRK